MRMTIGLEIVSSRKVWVSLSCKIDLPTDRLNHTMPKPRAQTSEVSSTRDQVLLIAEELLHQHGYLGVSLETVAQRIGIRKASLYYHFPGGKEELMLEIAHGILKRDEDGFKRAIASSVTASGQLRAVARWMATGPGPTELVLHDSMRFMPEEHQGNLTQSFFAKLYQPIHDVVVAGISSKEFRSHDTELSTWSILAILAEVHKMLPHTKNPKTLPDRLINFFIRGLHA
jgi:AcrR family transcriptional regulator